jgi:flagellar basal body-associated protein FliL
MGRSLVVALLALVGLLCAAGMGYAAYVVSRGSVAVPVTRLQPSPQQLTPAEVRARPKATTTRKRATTTTTYTTSTGSTTVDDHGGRSGRDGGGSGSGSDSGNGGGHGGDD